MKWWKILICVLVLIFLCVLWYFYNSTPVEEGFQIAALSDTIHTATITNTDTNGTNSATYSIFDPTAAYLQADIYALEYAIPLGSLYSIENNFTQNVLPKLLDNTFPRNNLTQDILRNIANIGVGNSIGANTSIGKTLREPTEQGLKYILPDPTSYYQSRDAQFMAKYNLTQKFSNHPIGFIISNTKPSVKAFINCGYRPLQLNKLLSADSIGGSDSGYTTYLNKYGRPAIYSNLNTGFNDANKNENERSDINNLLYPSNLFDIYEIMSYVAPHLSYRDSGDTSRCYPNKTIDTVATGAGARVSCDQYKQIEGWHNSRDDGTSCWEDYLATGRLTSASLVNDADFRGCGCIKKTMTQRKDDRFMKMPCPQTHVSKQCITVAGEKDGTESINPGAGIEPTILSNPATWTLKSFLKNPSPFTLNIINDFVSSKGITARGDANFSGATSKLLYTTVSVTGTISALNKTEIRKSVYYSMYFNFTDPSKTSQQICVEYDSPCKLYMFPDCSGMDEFKYFNGATIRNDTAIGHNLYRRKELTDDILKVLPFQTRDYIRRWALKRRARIIKLYEQECAPLKNGFSGHIGTVGGSFGYASQSVYSLAYINNMKIKCCPIESNPFSNYSEPDQYFTGDSTLYNIFKSGTYTSETESSFKRSSTYSTTPMTCTGINPIPKRSYNETLGDDSTDARGDVAPKFNLMSSPILSPPVYIVKSQNKFTPTFTIDTTATQENTYKNTINIDTQNPSSVLFLVPNIYVTVENITNALNSYTAVIDSYSNGVLNLKNIRTNGIFINGAIQAGNTPGSLPNDFYTVSYTDDTALNQESITALTVVPEQITPVINSSIELKIALSVETNFPINANVFITNNSDASSYFSGKISQKVNSTLYSLITVNTITNISGTFTNPAVYAVILMNAGSTTNRYWLTTQEKQQILNMIATKYYQLTGGQKKIQTIFDVYQVGDTIFDIRYLEYKRDTSLTQTIQGKMNVLTAEYKLYRTYNLSNDQILDLDLTYTQNMIELNSQLDNAIEGLGTNCGISARYIEIQRTDVNTATTTSHTDESGIQLSQVIVIDNTGNNAAMNSFVTASSTYIYDFEKTSLYSYISEPNCTIASDGSIKKSNNETVLGVGTCGSTPSPEFCTRDESGVVYVKRATSNRGDTAEILTKKLIRNQSLVDGQVKIIDRVANRYNTRVIPYFFRTQGVTEDEKVTIDLGSNTDIVKVRLVFPKGYSALPNYTIKFLNSNKNYINIPGTSATSVNNLTKSGKRTASSDVLDIDCLQTGRNPALPMCVTDLLEPYKVARFYANIGNGYVYGKPRENLAHLSFTGFSDGINAALTFNPMYNAGFAVNTGNTSGNINYNPRIQYNLNPIVSALPSGSSNLCTVNSGVTVAGAGTVSNPVEGSQITASGAIVSILATGAISTIGAIPTNILSSVPPGSIVQSNGSIISPTGNFLINVLRDYMTNISQYSFLNRPDVRSRNYDPSTYSYNVTKILGAKETSPGNYEIKWQERRTKLTTNVKDDAVERYGLFVYKRNLENWAANNEYYDIKNSILRDNGDGISYTTCNIDVPDLLPVEAISLDSAGGICPLAKCSDINVINQLVQQFNDLSGSKFNKQILRVTKAVTVSPNRCDFEVFQQNGTVSASEKKNISMDLNVIYDDLTSSCKYVWEESDINNGQFIQSNTPSLLHIYNYVSEVMKPYIDSLTSIKTNLSTLISDTTINTDYRKYLEDSYGAYGQIKDLSGCNALDNNAGKAKCYSPTAMSEFMKVYNRAYRGSKIIQQITHAGTASDNECDYIISVGTIATISGSTATISQNGTTEGVRAKMKKSTDCYFSVDTTYNIDSYTTGLKSYMPSMTNADTLRMRSVALNQTPWTTPITLGTQTTATTLNLTPIPSSVNLIVPSSNSYVDRINKPVSVIDMNNSNNNFNAVIQAYTPATTTLTLNNITDKSGTFNISTKYTIRAIPQNRTATQGISPVETLDYVDCTSPYVKKILQTANYNSIGTSIINKTPTVCETNGQQYQFTVSTDLSINSLETVSVTSGKSGSITNSRTTRDDTNMDGPTSIINSITTSQAQAVYPSIDITTAFLFVSPNTWDFRVNISDTLPFGDTYKRIRFYRDSSSNIRIRQIRDAPLTSAFAFFKRNSQSSNVLSACANIARDWWNTQYSVVTSTTNKIIIGNITGYYYDEVNDKIIFKATACEYGTYGPTDVRVDPKDRYFSTQFRQRYGQTAIVYNRDSLTSTTISVFSMVEITTVPTGTLISLSYAYNAMPEDSRLGYDPSKTLDDVLRATSKFRHLRFSVQKTPNSSTNPNKAVEILEMSFYKNTLPTPTTAPLLFNYATYSVDGIELLNYNVYDTPNLTTSVLISISPVVNGTITLTNLVETGIFSTNTSVIVYDTPTATNYFLGVITAIAQNSISIRCTSVFGTFTNPVNYTIAYNKCNSNYTASPDNYLLSYMKCRLTNPVTYTMLTLNDGSFNLPCSIGYVQSGSVCTSTGIYSSVIRQNMNKNLSVPRLQLNKDQYFNINLNESVEIKYYNFTTGVANTRPQRWKLEGSMCGLPDRWVPIHTVTSDYLYTDEVLHSSSIKTPTNKNIYSFVTTNFFPIFSGTTVTRRNDSGTTKNYLFDPSISQTSPTSPYVENFQNSVLHEASTPKFRRRVPNLENSYVVPLKQPVSNIPANMQIEGKRRIQYLRIKILSTRKNTGFIHMSNLQFITPLGPLPSSHYKITNPMGIHPSRNNGPDALSMENGVWIISNNEPLLVKFSTLPQIILEGFQFSAPQNSRAFDSLPATWIVEGSYDGRIWSTYHEALVPESFSSYDSPVYKFLKHI